MKPWTLFLLGGAIGLGSLVTACGDDTSGQGGDGGSGASGGGQTNQSGSQSGTGTMSTTATMMASTSSGPLTCDVPVTDITGDCDLFQQNCPAGETCIIFVDDPVNPTMAFTGCNPAGLVGLGQACQTAEDCQEDMLCIGTNPGMCTYACCPTTNEPCGVGECVIDVMLPMSLGSFSACAYDQTCTLFMPSTCPDGQDCHYAQPGLATCSPPSPTQVGDGEPCRYANDCVDSAICIPVTPGMDMPRECRFMCQDGSSAMPGLGGCPSGQTCDVTVYDFGFPGMGYCHP
jgi:hypothetical protein